MQVSLKKYGIHNYYMLKLGSLISVVLFRMILREIPPFIYIYIYNEEYVYIYMKKNAANTSISKEST